MERRHIRFVTVAVVVIVVAGLDISRREETHLSKTKWVATWLRSIQVTNSWLDWQNKTAPSFLASPNDLDHSDWAYTGSKLSKIMPKMTKQQVAHRISVAPRTSIWADIVINFIDALSRLLLRNCWDRPMGLRAGFWGKSWEKPKLVKEMSEIFASGKCLTYSVSGWFDVVP